MVVAEVDTVKVEFCISNMDVSVLALKLITPPPTLGE
jgi:hypothetical protein